MGNLFSVYLKPGGTIRTDPDEGSREVEFPEPSRWSRPDQYFWSSKWGSSRVSTDHPDSHFIIPIIVCTEYQTPTRVSSPRKVRPSDRSVNRFSRIFTLVTSFGSILGSVCPYPTMCVRVPCGSSRVNFHFGSLLNFWQTWTLYEDNGVVVFHLRDDRTPQTRVVDWSETHWWFDVLRPLRAPLGPIILLLFLIFFFSFFIDGL